MADMETVTANAGFSITFRRAEWFTFDEVIFLICGLEPLKRLQKNDSCTEQVVSQRGGWSGPRSFPKYFVSASEKRDVTETQNMLNGDVLRWGDGRYHHANPAIVNQQIVPSAHYESDEARLHDQFIKFFNGSSSAFQEILQIQIDGLNRGTDYATVVSGLRTEMLIPQRFIAEIEWLESICNATGRDLTGDEVQTYLRADGYTASGQTFYRDRHSDKGFTKTNIAAYLAAKQINSIFDFGQHDINAVDLLTKVRIEAALKRHDHVKIATAKHLGVTRHVLDIKIAEFEINVPASKFDPKKKTRQANKATFGSGLGSRNPDAQ